MRDTPRNGIGVDRSGGPVIDPTKNVEDAIDSLKEHISDLRQADDRLETERNRHIEFVAKLRARHADQLFSQNNERLSALRQVDISTRNEDRKTADDAIRQLANQTESLRQTLSKQVTDTAETLSKAKIESDKATELRISALERSSYIGAGEKAVADPAMAQFVNEIKKLGEGAGERRGGQQTINAIIVVASLLVGLGGLAVAVFK